MAKPIIKGGASTTISFGVMFRTRAGIGRFSAASYAKQLLFVARALFLRFEQPLQLFDLFVALRRCL